MAHIPQKHKLIYSMVNSLEARSAESATVLITVADKLLATFRSKPKDSVVIMNCSDDNFVHKNILDKQNNGAEKFTLVFPGNITRDRGLEQVSEAINGLDDVELVIAGRPVDGKLLSRILEVPNVKYVGLLIRKDALELISKSDAMIILYDPKVPNNNFSASNKLFEAMMFGIPIITNVSSEIVDAEMKCGITVRYGDLDRIRGAIVRLRDDVKLRKQLGNNGRNAYLQTYNWTNMEKKLFRIYEALLYPS